VTTDDPDVEHDEERRNFRLNVALCGVVALGLAAALLGGLAIGKKYESDGGDVSGGWWQNTTNVILDKRPEIGGSRAGEHVGDAQISAVSLASDDEQARTAAILESATDIANAFLNIDHDDVEKTVDQVRSLATGQFLQQYNKSIKGFSTAARRAKAVQTSKVVWAGLVDSDPDSATVLVATTGTVANKITHFEPQSRTYRLQLDLVDQDGKWLTRDLQFVQ
jgi:Mce-associated membrane protein